MIAPALKTIYTCFPGGRNKVLTMSCNNGRVEDKVYNPSACSVWLDVNGEKAEVPGLGDQGLFFGGTASM